MLPGATGPASPTSRDFAPNNVESLFGQQPCFCGCYNHHQNPTPTKPVGSNGVGKQRSQVLTFPDSKPIPSFNEGRRMSISTSNMTSWKSDFQCPSCPGFRSTETQQQQTVGAVAQQPCCFPPMMSGGNVEVVKIGEGPPLTWADIQRHGGLPFPDTDDWQPRAPTFSAQKCASWKGYSSQQPKRTPISEYTNWTQRKKQPPQVVELPSSFMIHQSQPPATVQVAGPSSTPQGVKPSGCGRIYHCDQQQQQQQQQPQPQTTAPTQSQMATTTVQTEMSMTYPQAGMMVHQCSCTRCQCSSVQAQNFGLDPWQGAMEANCGNGGGSGGCSSTPMRGMSDVRQQQQKKFSLPPASHHSPEQRTSYRVKRVY